MAGILDLAQGGVGKTKIMYGAGMSFPQINDYLSFLLDVDLLEVIEPTEKPIYRTTNKGLQYLRYCKEIGELLKNTHAQLNIREGEQIVVTYTSTANKMKVFSAFILEGLESGDAVWYSYPDEESETVRTKLREHGVDVEKYERKGALILVSLTEDFMPNGKLDYDKAVIDGIKWWAEMRRKGYKHIRDIEDVGDFSFVNGQWQKWVKEYWLDPRWEDPNVSEWVVSKGPVGAVYIPSLMSLTAVDVERMTRKQVDEVLKAFGRTAITSKRFFIDLLEDMNSFSRMIGLHHEQLLGRKILLEFDPASNYEKVVDSLMRESMANVEPIFVLTSRTNPIHTHLAEHPAAKFIFLSTSASTPELKSENEVILPATDTALILQVLSEVLEKFTAPVNVTLVFDKLSELIHLMGFSKAYGFLLDVLYMLSQTKITTIFLLNKKAHEPQVISQIRSLFHNLLTNDKEGLKVLKIS